MALSTGSRLGLYEISAPLGVGGMGEVYRAHDTRLRRDVALKVLPEALRLDPERLGRFEHEARVLASLNHPNIAAIYGLEDSGGIAAIVLELVEGETLAERIARGAIAVSDALTIARQIAAALEAAHDKGIVHRDLKPANISITPAGLVKVLDFGLAKITTPVQGAMPDTMTAGATREGVVVGTAAYMSPEQARGQTVDKRTDIWAFGCVLYEMLTGQRLFEGQSATDTLALLLTKDPDWSALPPQVPAAVRTLLRRCLEREQLKRLGDVSAIRFALEDVANLSATDLQAAPVPARHGGGPPWTRRAVLAAGAVLLIAAAAASFVVWNSGPAPAESGSASTSTTRFTITLPPGLRLAGLARPAIALSADGRQLAYVATAQGEDARQIYMYSMASGETRPIPGTERASNPFFSPDGKWLGFYGSDLQLKKVPVSGGVAIDLANVTIPLGASWGSQRAIAYAPYLSVIQQLPEEGGAAQPLTQFESGETQHLWPEFLPGGKALLFATVSASSTMAIAVQPIAGTRKNLQGQLGTIPRYAPSGHLVYAQEGNLMAVPFDLARLEIKNGSVPIAAVKGVSQDGRTAQYGLSASGSLVYVPGKLTTGEHALVSVTRDGTERQLGAPLRAYNQPRVSPDGQRVAVDVNDTPGSMQVWLYDLARDQFTPFTYRDTGTNRHAVWQDATRIVFMSSRIGNGTTQLFSESVEGGGLKQLTSFPPAPGADNLPIPYSLCGNVLTFVRNATFEAWTLAMTDPPPATGRQLNLQAAADGAPQFSPDCRWLAYTSEDSGRREIFVRAFPGLDNKRQISMDGGNEPMWNPNPRKRELFYRSGDKMMAVDIGEDGSASGKAKELFRGSYEVTRNGYARPNYDPFPDGERFLLLKPAEQEPLTQITVVLNWIDELKRLAPPTDPFGHPAWRSRD